MIDRFDRNISREKHSWCYKVYKDYLTEINQYYWTLIPLASEAEYRVRNSGFDNQRFSTATFFNASGPDVRKIPPYLLEWQENFNKFQKWNRINTLVSIISNFETYLSSIIKVAFESNPGLLLNYSNIKENSVKIDGVSYLKNGAFTGKYRELIEEIVEQITKGDWQRRTSMFYRIFPDAPSKFKESISELEHARKLRNNAAHSFGRRIDVAVNNRSFKKIDETDTLSEKRLMAYFALFSSLTESIDEYLLNTHIGAYEVIHFYHKNYVEKYNIDRYNSKWRNELKRELTKEAKIDSWGKRYIESMIKYYHSI